MRMFSPPDDSVLSKRWRSVWDKDESCSRVVVDLQRSMAHNRCSILVVAMSAICKNVGIAYS